MLNHQSPKWAFAKIPAFAPTCESSVLVWFMAQDAHARDEESPIDDPISANPPEVSLAPGRTAAQEPRVDYRAEGEETSPNESRSPASLNRVTHAVNR